MSEINVKVIIYCTFKYIFCLCKNNLQKTFQGVKHIFLNKINTVHFMDFKVLKQIWYDHN